MTQDCQTSEAVAPYVIEVGSPIAPPREQTWTLPVRLDGEDVKVRVQHPTHSQRRVVRDAMDDLRKEYGPKSKGRPVIVCRKTAEL